MTTAQANLLLPNSLINKREFNQQAVLSKQQSIDQHNNAVIKMLESHKTLLLGHRGARGEKMENSWGGFEYTQKVRQHANNKLVGIEFDVQLTKDNRLAVFHDNDLSRLYQTQQRVDQTTYQTLKRLSARTYPIPLLDDLLNHHSTLFNKYERIELEVKTHQRTNYLTLVAALATTLNQIQFKDIPIVLTSFDIPLLECLQNHPTLASIKRGLLVESKSFGLAPTQPNSNALSTNVPTNELYTIPYTALRLGCAGIALHYPLFNSEVMALCRRFNLTTTAWTANRSADVVRLAQLGVDYIITDYPAQMLGLNAKLI